MAERQATLDTLSGQRTGAVGMQMSKVPSGFKPTKTLGANITSTPETRALEEQGAFSKSIGAPQSTYYQDQSTNALMTPFGQPDLARSSYAGAQYEGPRETMNNTQMAQRNRMLKSMEGQVGSLSPTKAPIASMPQPTSSGIRELQQTGIAIGNPFGPEPEDVRLTGLRRTGKIIRGR